MSDEKHCPIHGIRHSQKDQRQGFCLARLKNPVWVCLVCHGVVSESDLRDETLIHKDCGGHCEKRRKICMRPLTDVKVTPHQYQGP